ncbi:hypothetical protein K438DRAFT_1974823 [Mycena galopus ATCC 62051]|nr:hypothetical protein K438DRAFT_1974823 [Mycena galopus ATCC 62051]
MATTVDPDWSLCLSSILANYKLHFLEATATLVTQTLPLFTAAALLAVNELLTSSRAAYVNGGRPAIYLLCVLDATLWPFTRFDAEYLRPSAQVRVVTFAAARRISAPKSKVHLPVFLTETFLFRAEERITMFLISVHVSASATVQTERTAHATL